jgi:hypothetical protein
MVGFNKILVEQNKKQELGQEEQTTRVGHLEPFWGFKVERTKGVHKEFPLVQDHPRSAELLRQRRTTQEAQDHTGSAGPPKSAGPPRKRRPGSAASLRKRSTIQEAQDHPGSTAPPESAGQTKSAKPSRKCKTTQEAQES